MNTMLTTSLQLVFRVLAVCKHMWCDCKRVAREMYDCCNSRCWWIVILFAKVCSDFTLPKWKIFWDGLFGSVKIFLIDEKYFHASVLEVARGLCDHYVHVKCVEFRGISSVHTVARGLYECCTLWCKWKFYSVKRVIVSLN